VERKGLEDYVLEAYPGHIDVLVKLNRSSEWIFLVVSLEGAKREIMARSTVADDENGSGPDEDEA